ncbi:MAG TPA: hypothetical protein VL978_02905 [Puia sp.]|nr:hypothetical protein [Puia sp.]
MLPVYRAISFQRVAEKGGRTKPWVVLVDAGISVEPYVVKVFTPELIQEKDSVTREVLGNVLARQFDLNVPNAALIDFDDDFKDSVRDLNLLDHL